MPDRVLSSPSVSWIGLASGLASGLAIGLAVGLIWPGCSTGAAGLDGPRSATPQPATHAAADTPADSSTSPSTATPAPASHAASPSAPGFVARLVRDQPSPDAPPQLSQQFGRLTGTWQCKGANRKPDGTWKDNPAPATWTWFYTLDGTAIQDVWESSAKAGGIGTNLRVFDSDTQSWHIVWATTGQKDLTFFKATAQNDDIVMTGDQPARKPFPAHTARITFHSITTNSFAWRYEASALGGGSKWTEFSRLQCQRSP